MAGDARTIGIISIKGGVGKTSCTINLASALASLNKKTLAIDANYSAPNLGMHVGMIKPDITLNEVMNRGIDVSNAIYSYHDGLHILPSSIVGRKVNPNDLKNKLKNIKHNYEVMVIDSSPNLNEEMLSTIAASDELLVVTTPDFPTLSCTIHAIKVAKRKNTPITGLVLNKVRNKHYELDTEDIESACDAPVLAMLPDSNDMLEALALSKPVLHHRPNAEISVEYMKLAASLIGEKYSDPRIFSQIKNMFRTKIPKHELNRLMLKNDKQ